MTTNTSNPAYTMAAIASLLAVASVLALTGQTFGSRCTGAHWGQPDDAEFRPLAPVQIPPGHARYEVSMPNPGYGCEPVGIHFAVCEDDAQPEITVLRPWTILVSRRGDINLPAQMYSSVKCVPLVPTYNPSF